MPLSAERVSSQIVQVTNTDTGEVIHVSAQELSKTTVILVDGEKVYRTGDFDDRADQPE